MNLAEFNELKNKSVFINHNGTIEEQLKSAEETIERGKLPLRNEIIDLITKYGNFYFDKTEQTSGDRIRFYFMPLFEPSYYWEKYDRTAVFIGEVVNSSCGGSYKNRAIESFYMLSDGSFYNQNEEKIAESIESFLDYMMTAEYDYHAPISESTYMRLKNGGWYEGRKADISGIVMQCKENNILLTNEQKQFLEEFSGIECIMADGQDLVIYSDFSGEISRACADTDDFDEKWVYDRYDKQAICIGDCFTGECNIWLSGKGQLILQGIVCPLKDDGWFSYLGRTVMEGFNVLLGE